MASFGDIAIQVPSAQPVTGRQDRQAATATAEGFSQLFEATTARWLAEQGAGEPGVSCTTAESSPEEGSGGVPESFLETLLAPLAQFPLPLQPQPAGVVRGGEDSAPDALDVQAIGGTGLPAIGAAAPSLPSVGTVPEQVSVMTASMPRPSGHKVVLGGTESRQTSAGEVISEVLTGGSGYRGLEPASDATGPVTGAPDATDGPSPGGHSPWAGKIPTDAAAASSLPSAGVVEVLPATKRAGAQTTPSQAGRAGDPSMVDPATEALNAPFAAALESEEPSPAAVVTRPETRTVSQGYTSAAKTDESRSGPSPAPSAPPEAREPAALAGRVPSDHGAFAACLEAAGGSVDTPPAREASPSPVEPNRVAGQVLGHAARLAWPSRSRMVVQLEPQNLGKVELRLSMHDGVLSLDIQTQLPQTRETVEAALPQLRSSLEDRGIEVGRLFASSDGLAAGLSSGGQSAFGSSADRSGGWPSTHGARAVLGIEEQPSGQPGPVQSADRLVDYLV